MRTTKEITRRTRATKNNFLNEVQETSIKQSLQFCDSYVGRDPVKEMPLGIGGEEHCEQSNSI